ncbi:2Fe-2S iron-sulfur cluster binding domain-containing protein [Pseudomonas sp. GD03721]|nr:MULTISPECIES: 2Fe-2S iron-sulfur cluster binding domain-containing protein [unclassified Pseudomonas]MDH1440467.1 2Fe-2S iron-sulfur cluster binding domain-containing protein [Pseudomonas sp. GD03722]WGG03445.1 2Fe-2S iron-sulfur cluster binding domain-containing protein [Pseudomonas sp. GD03721]WGG07613.1 2Fe-2S iron-sulfur cluster binding domain-containing protein [Pseudomonas sp. GD03919]
MVAFLKSLFRPKPVKTVTVQPFERHFEVRGSETLLEAALLNQVPFPHNCTVGTCAACKCRLVSGRVKAITDFGYTLSRQELEAGYILACQAVPLEEETTVEIIGSGIDAPPAEQFAGTLVKTEALTHDILRVEISLDRPLKFVAGQYANLHHEGLSRSRSYSFADAPDPKGSSSVSFMIRKVPGGEFTEALFAGSLTGKPLEVEAPHGDFFLRPSTAPMICVAGGSGLAPLLSILEDARKKRVERSCTVLFGARTTADLYALEQLATIGRGWKGYFNFVPVLSHEPEGSAWTGARGLVTDFIAPSLNREPHDKTEMYMCGPPGMIDRAIETAAGHGIAIERIHYDKFTDQSTTAPR